MSSGDVVCAAGGEALLSTKPPPWLGRLLLLSPPPPLLWNDELILVEPLAGGTRGGSAHTEGGGLVDSSLVVSSASEHERHTEAGGTARPRDAVDREHDHTSLGNECEGGPGWGVRWLATAAGEARLGGRARLGAELGFSSPAAERAPPRRTRRRRRLKADAAEDDIGISIYQRVSLSLCLFLVAPSARESADCALAFGRASRTPESQREVSGGKEWRSSVHASSRAPLAARLRRKAVAASTSDCAPSSTDWRDDHAAAGWCRSIHLGVPSPCPPLPPAPMPPQCTSV